MVNNIDYREIVQTVTVNVLTDVKNQLASMQPGIVNDIVESVQSSLQTTLDSITSQLGDMQQRLTKLEQKKGRSSSVQSKSTQTSRASGTAKKSSAPPPMDSQTRILLLKIQGLGVKKIQFKGWIFYLAEEKKGVFMIRANGTDKKCITKKFKEYPTQFINVIENGSDWIIEYEYHYEHKVKGKADNRSAITAFGGGLSRAERRKIRTGCTGTEYAVIPKP